jgi:hypothetical protein
MRAVAALLCAHLLVSQCVPSNEAEPAADEHEQAFKALEAAALSTTGFPMRALLCDPCAI